MRGPIELILVAFERESPKEQNLLPNFAPPLTRRLARTLFFFVKFFGPLPTPPRFARRRREGACELNEKKKGKKGGFGGFFPFFPFFFPFFHEFSTFSQFFMIFPILHDFSWLFPFLMQNDRANRMQQKSARSVHAFSRKQENTVNKNKKEKTTYTYLRYIPSRSSYGAWINLIFTPIDFSRDSTSGRHVF